MTLTVRGVKDVEAYKTAFAAYATGVQSKTEGVRTMFSFMDSTKDNTALQVAWYDSAEVLAGLEQDEALEATYAPSDADYGAVIDWFDAPRPIFVTVLLSPLPRYLATAVTRSRKRSLPAVSSTSSALSPEDSSSRPPITRAAPTTPGRP